ncbi:partial protease I, partial [uncultured bacterium]
MRNRFLMPNLIFAFFILSNILIVQTGESAMQSVKGKKAVIIIASNNFRDEELLKPKEVLEKNGVAVTVASSSLKEATGMLGAKVKPDILFSN